ncbi:MAG: FAD-binding protein [Deltaproteobacteria bacterium]|nr:FAD-binding protein [Deltaproteobacteria bacterium]
MTVTREADVIIVGYGGAGAVAAITAHDSGAQVLILEKSAEAGGNTRLAVSSFTSVIPGASAKEHLGALCSRTLEDDVIDAYIEWASKNVDFVRELGGDPVPYFPGPTFPGITGAEAMLRFRPFHDALQGDGGRRLWRLLEENVEKRGIEVMTSTPVCRLIQGSRKEVVGVETNAGGSILRVLARRAVILTCGGFEFDETMKREYLRISQVFALGHPDNTGDGIRMAQEVGAAIWHMGAIACPLGYKFPEYESAFDSHMPGEGYIAVDRYGERFMNEYGGLYTKWLSVSHFIPERLEWPRVPCFFVFDDRTRLLGPISHVYGGNRGVYQWSADNSVEIGRGWILWGNSLAELGEKMYVPAKNKLEMAVARYNQFCSEGEDRDFARSRETLIPLETSPFYAIEVFPCLLNTQGGPKHNAKAQVVDPWGHPIPRLYAAGELGSIWGFMYQSGGNLGECLAFGRIAGMNAAQEKPRTRENS